MVKARAERRVVNIYKMTESYPLVERDQTIVLTDRTHGYTLKGEKQVKRIDGKWFMRDD